MIKKLRAGLEEAVNTMELVLHNSDNGCWKHDHCDCNTGSLKRKIDKLKELLKSTEKSK